MTTEYQKMREQQRDIIAAQIEAADERAFYWKIEQEAIAEQKAAEALAESERKALIKAAEDLLIANELEAKKKKEEEEERRRREAQSASQPAPVQDPTPSVAPSTSSATCTSDSGSTSDGGGCSGGDGGGGGGSCD